MKKYKLTFIAVLSAIMLVFSACGQTETVISDESDITEADASVTTVSVSDSPVSDATFKSDSDSPVAEFVGWWYRPDNLDGIPLFTIFEVHDDSTFTIYDKLKNVVASGNVIISGDEFGIDVPDYGEIFFTYDDGVFYDIDGSIAFERGDELEAPDISFVYGAWYQDGDTSANCLTLSEDGTFDDYDSYVDYHTTGNFETATEIQMINGIDAMDGEESLLIRLGTADDFFPKEYYVMPSGITIYTEDGWDGIAIYTKEGADGETFEYDCKLLSLTNRDNNWSNDNYSLTFYKNGYFSIDSIEVTEDSYSSRYFMHGTYTVDDGFTNVHLTFDDNSFDGDCPLDLESGTLSVEPLGELS